MKKGKFIAKLITKLMRLNKILKIATIVAAVSFSLVFVILFAWEAIAPYTAPMWIVWTLIAVTLLAYLLAGAYLANEFVVGIYTRKLKKK